MTVVKYAALFAYCLAFGAAMVFVDIYAIIVAFVALTVILGYYISKEDD